jgi:hypothetical protein
VAHGAALVRTQDVRAAGLPAGEAFQFDWSEDFAALGDELTRLQVAHLKLSHSRAFLVRAVSLQSHDLSH